MIELGMPESTSAWFFFSFAIALGAVASPGPVSTTIVSQSTRSGWLTGPLISVGHAILELALTLVIAFGLSSALANPSIQTGIALFGGVLLLWMGGSMIFNAISGKARMPHQDDDEIPLNRWQILGLGILTTATNPFWYAWWITVAARYLNTAKGMGFAAVGAFYLGHISADMGWNTMLSSVVGGGRRWLTDNIFRAIIGCCGVFLAYIGISFLIQGFQAFFQ